MAGKDTAKFTQLVWKSTVDFGIAFATKKNKDNLYCTYVVAKYSPAGNKAGSYKDNVQKGSFLPSICDSLNTIAFNAAMENKPIMNAHWSFGPSVANQVLKAINHEAGTFEPFKMPVYHVNQLKPTPVIIHSKRCKDSGAESPVCRGNAYYLRIYLILVSFALFPAIKMDDRACLCLLVPWFISPQNFQVLLSPFVK